jgi:hypothetical protein
MSKKNSISETQSLEEEISVLKKTVKKLEIELDNKSDSFNLSDIIRNSTKGYLKKKISTLKDIYIEHKYGKIDVDRLGYDSSGRDINRNAEEWQLPQQRRFIQTIFSYYNSEESKTSPELILRCMPEPITKETGIQVSVVDGQHKSKTILDFINNKYGIPETKITIFLEGITTEVSISGTFEEIANHEYGSQVLKVFFGYEFIVQAGEMTDKQQGRTLRNLNCGKPMREEDIRHSYMGKHRDFICKYGTWDGRVKGGLIARYFHVNTKDRSIDKLNSQIFNFYLNGKIKASDIEKTYEDFHDSSNGNILSNKYNETKELFEEFQKILKEGLKVLPTATQKLPTGMYQNLMLNLYEWYRRGYKVDKPKEYIERFIEDEEKRRNGIFDAIKYPKTKTEVYRKMASCANALQWEWKLLVQFHDSSIHTLYDEKRLNQGTPQETIDAEREQRKRAFSGRYSKSPRYYITNGIVTERPSSIWE